MKAKQWCLAAVMAGVAGSVSAGEGSFGWLYTLDLQPKGTLEFEQKIDLTTAQAAGKYNLWKTKTGLEYGVTNNFQLTGYLNGYSVSANQNYTNSDACGGSPPAGLEFLVQPQVDPTVKPSLMVHQSKAFGALPIQSLIL